MKHRAVIGTAVGCVALLFLIDQAFHLAAGNPVAAATVKTVAEGWQEQDLGQLRVRTSYAFFGSTGQVEFYVRNSKPAKTIRVNLRRPMYSSKWQVTASYTSDKRSNS
jgi:hypothetical protein